MNTSGADAEAHDAADADEYQEEEEEEPAEDDDPPPDTTKDEEDEKEHEGNDESDAKQKELYKEEFQHDGDQRKGLCQYVEKESKKRATSDTWQNGRGDGHDCSWVKCRNKGRGGYKGNGKYGKGWQHGKGYHGKAQRQRKVVMAQVERQPSW